MKQNKRQVVEKLQPFIHEHKCHEILLLVLRHILPLESRPTSYLRNKQLSRGQNFRVFTVC